MFVLSFLLRAVVTLAIGWLVVAGLRMIRRRSAVLGIIVTVAIVTRLVLGLSLFVISYFGLPIAETIQVKGGFWQPALDATGYYQLAAEAANTRTLFSLDHAVPAPLYINMLAVWMLAVGISPVAGMFLNLCLYVALVALIVRAFDPVNAWRRDLPCIIGVTAYSFSPVILFHSTQPMKDELFHALVALLCLGVLGLRHLVYRTSPSQETRSVAMGAMVVAAAVFGTAALRWYYPLIATSALAVLLFIFTFVGRTTSLPRYLAGSAVVLLAAWLGFWGGAGPYYRIIGANLETVSQVVRLPSDLAVLTQVSRAGFVTSGGGTNVTIPLSDDSAKGQARLRELREAQRKTALYLERVAEQQPESPVAAASAPAATVESATAAPETPEPEASPAQKAAALAVPVNILDHATAVAMGLAMVFVPVSIINAVSSVEIAGGRGLLALVDLDTLFLDATIIAVFVLLWKRRGAVGDRAPFVVFALTLAAATALLLGYVVTNFGTLWRMRSLIAVPLWLLVAALSPRAPATPRPSRSTNV